MQIDFLLMRGPDDTDPPKFATLDLPMVPEGRDKIKVDGRTYMVLDRSATVVSQSVEGQRCDTLKWGLLVRQMDGPPHLDRPHLVVAQ